MELVQAQLRVVDGRSCPGSPRRPGAPTPRRSPPSPRPCSPAPEAMHRGRVVLRIAWRGSGSGNFLASLTLPGTGRPTQPGAASAVRRGAVRHRTGVAGGSAGGTGRSHQRRPSAAPAGQRRAGRTGRVEGTRPPVPARPVLAAHVSVVNDPDADEHVVVVGRRAAGREIPAGGSGPRSGFLVSTLDTVQELRLARLQLRLAVAPSAV